MIDEKIFSEPSYYDDPGQQRVANLVVAIFRTMQEVGETEDSGIITTALCSILASQIIAQSDNNPTLQQEWIKCYVDCIKKTLEYNGVSIHGPS